MPRPPLTIPIGALLLMLACMLPASAMAGATVTKGNETARLTVTKLALPGAPKDSRGARLRYRVALGTVDGKRSNERLKRITIRAPSGLSFNPSAVPTCLLSKWNADPNYRCPKGTKVASGTGTADARPTIPDLIDTTATAFNGKLDQDASEAPQSPRPGLLIEAQIDAKNGVGVVLETTSHGKIVYRSSPPTGSQQSLYEIVGLDLTLGVLGKGKTPYVQLPSRCPKSGAWRFSLTEVFRSGLTLTALHDVKCA